MKYLHLTGHARETFCSTGKLLSVFGYLFFLGPVHINPGTYKSITVSIQNQISLKNHKNVWKRSSKQEKGIKSKYFANFYQMI